METQTLHKFYDFLQNQTMNLFQIINNEDGDNTQDILQAFCKVDKLYEVLNCATGMSENKDHVNNYTKFETTDNKKISIPPINQENVQTSITEKLSASIGNAITSKVYKWYCEECGRSFYTQEKFEKHSRSKCVYQCAECDLKYFDKNAYFEHSCQQAKKSLFCTQCTAAFASNRLLQIHLNNHKKYGLNFYECHICGIHTFSANNLNMHLTNYHNLSYKNGISYMCLKCNRTFNTIYLLLSHSAERHAEADVTFCHRCKACFSKDCNCIPVE